ncbi:MAG: 23S rRNA (guanosine(2251)-2'-O)-methyltransferase RlmB [Pseudomonadota bacterium]
MAFSSGPAYHDRAMSTPHKKPAWVIEKERARRSGPEPVWLFGLHAVRDALANPKRRIDRLVVTRNAAEKLRDAIDARGVAPEEANPRKFPVALDPGSVHQGAALLTPPLDWGDAEEICAPTAADPNPIVVLLDRVTDPHNVGAILRSAEVFGARAVIAPLRHAAPETGALAKSASGALERQPYIRVKNLASEMERLRTIGYRLVGLDGEANVDLGAALAAGPIGLVLGAEGPGLREKTKETCDAIAKIPFATDFGSLNVSNAAAVALYAAAQR